MSNARFWLAGALIGGFLLAGAPRPSPAQVPATPGMINFQGRLKDASGNPINGVQSILFSIFNAPVGGASLWSETQASVVVSTGLYNVALGSVTPFPPIVFQSSGTWLEIKVGGDPPMAPRLQFQATPYAFTAQLASSLMSSLPVADLFSLTPVNQSVNNAGYTVPGGKNLIAVRIKAPNNPCAPNNCSFTVTGAHTATNLGGGALLGAGDVIASTGAALNFEVRGILVPASVTVVLQDLAASGGAYTAPATQSLYFGLQEIGTGCTGNININGFLTARATTGGILPPGATLTNSRNCATTLDGYLK